MAPHGLRDRRTRLVREWGRLVDGGGSPARPRDPDLRAEIAASWDRSRIVVDPHRDSAPASPDVADRWHTSALAGPVGVTTFDSPDEALKIANETLYGLGAGVWSRDGNTAYRMGRAIKAGRVWTNCYHAYPAHAAFGGYKQSGIGRENHRAMLDHYQQTKNLLVSYSAKRLGFF